MPEVNKVKFTYQELSSITNSAAFKALDKKQQADLNDKIVNAMIEGGTSGPIDLKKLAQENIEFNQKRIGGTATPVMSDADIKKIGELLKKAEDEKAAVDDIGNMSGLADVSAPTNAPQPVVAQQPVRKEAISASKTTKTKESKAITGAQNEPTVNPKDKYSDMDGRLTVRQVSQVSTRVNVALLALTETFKDKNIASTSINDIRNYNLSNISDKDERKKYYEELKTVLNYNGTPDEYEDSIGVSKKTADASTTRTADTQKTETKKGAASTKKTETLSKTQKYTPTGTYKDIPDKVKVSDINDIYHEELLSDVKKLNPDIVNLTVGQIRKIDMSTLQSAGVSMDYIEKLATLKNNLESNLPTIAESNKMSSKYTEKQSGSANDTTQTVSIQTAKTNDKAKTVPNAKIVAAPKAVAKKDAAPTAQKPAVATKTEVSVADLADTPIENNVPADISEVKIGDILKEALKNNPKLKDSINSAISAVAEFTTRNKNDEIDTDNLLNQTFKFIDDAIIDNREYGNETGLDRTKQIEAFTNLRSLVIDNYDAYKNAHATKQEPAPTAKTADAPKAKAKKDVAPAEMDFIEVLAPFSKAHEAPAAKTADAPKAETKKDTSSIGMLYQNYGKLTKEEQVTLTNSMMTLARVMPKAKGDSNSAATVEKLSMDDIRQAIKKNAETVQKYDNMEADGEDLTTEQSAERKNARVANKALEKLEELGTKHADLLKDITKAEQDEEHGALYNATAATFKAGAAVVKQADKELGISQMFAAVDKADQRVWKEVKDGKWYGARAAAQLVGEFGAQATAVTAAAGEHIKKYPEKGLAAINNMEEGATKEITQSTAGVAANAVSAVANTVSGITNLASWALKGGEYTNDDIDRIAGQTVKVIAEKMSDKSDANIKNIKTLFDIRQRLGVSDEEFKKLSTEQVEQLIKQRSDEKVISKETMLLAYGQITGEVTRDEAGKLIITDKTAGLDQLIKAAHQFDDMINDGLNIASSATGLLHKGTQALDNLTEIKNDDSALTTTGKYAAKIITTPVDVVAGSAAGIGNVASGLAKGLWALNPWSSTTLKDAGNQITQGVKQTVSGGHCGDEEAEAVEAAETQQTANRKAVAKAHDEIANQKAEIKAHKAKIQTDIDKLIGASGDKLLDEIIPKGKQAELKKSIETVAQSQLAFFINAAKERMNKPDITPEEKAKAEEWIAALTCLKEPDKAENKTKLLALYQKNHPEDKEMTADKLIAQAKAEDEQQVKENIKAGITALLRAAKNPADAKRLMTLAENDGFFGTNAEGLKKLLKNLSNRIDQAYDQNDFEQHGALFNFLDKTLLDGAVLEPFRLVFKESVSTTDKVLLSLICVNFIGSLTWMGSGLKKGVKGAKEVYAADYNPALDASGCGKVAGGSLQMAVGALLPKISCCDHLILGHHKYIDKWLGEDICCHKHHKVIKETTCPCKPKPKPDPDPCDIWGADPTWDPLYP